MSRNGLALRTEEPSPIENIPRVDYIGKKNKI